MQKFNLLKHDSTEQQKKLVRFSLLFLAFIFISLIIYSLIIFTINKDKTSTIKILVAPSDAIVSIDGRDFSTDTTLKFKPGTYTLKIEKAGFVSLNTTITTEPDQTTYIYEYLTELDKNGTYYKNHEKESTRTQQIADHKADLLHAPIKSGTLPHITTIILAIKFLPKKIMMAVSLSTSIFTPALVVVLKNLSPRLSTT